MQLWDAPRATGPVDAVVRIPGSKSVTNRALILAALADRPSLLRKPLRARDTELMAGALHALGVGIDDRDDAWTVTPAPLRGPATIDAGLAGTVMRFALPVAALADGPVRLDGDPQAYARPMHALTSGLRQLGVEVVGDRLPITVVGRGHAAGGTATVDASASSQFVSALLLAAARYDKGVELRHDGPPMPSLPHIAMTVDMLRRSGVEVDGDANVWRVAPSTIRVGEVEIEPDLSNAAPFLAAALVTAGRVTIPGWPATTTQPGDLLRRLCTSLGASVSLDAAGLTVRGPGAIPGVDLDLHEASELTPVIAAVLTLADGPSTIRGVAHIRFHETDRLAALAHELTAIGADVRETADGLEIRPKPLHSGVFGTYHDHRMAQAGAVIGLVVDGVQVENVGTTRKTLPDFVGMWGAL